MGVCLLGIGRPAPTKPARETMSNKRHTKRLGGGAELVVCSEMCLEVLSFDESITGYVETDEIPGQSCVHCWVCGGPAATLLTGWCALHGYDCPVTVWELTNIARDFAAAYYATTQRPVTDEILSAAQEEFYANPTLTGGQLAERVIAM